MQTRKLAAAVVVSLGCSILAASCVSPGPEAEGTQSGSAALETKDDVESDPDVGAGIGSEPPVIESPISRGGDCGSDPDVGSESPIGSPYGTYGSASPSPAGGCSPDPCREECERQAEECEAKCRKIPKGDKKRIERCFRLCNEQYARCIKKC